MVEPAYMYADPHETAAYVHKKCLELVLDPERHVVQGVRWHGGTRTAIEVVMRELPRRHRAKLAVIEKIGDFFEENCHVGFTAHSIVIDHARDYILVRLMRPD